MRSRRVVLYFRTPRLPAKFRKDLERMRATRDAGRLNYPPEARAGLDAIPATPHSLSRQSAGRSPRLPSSTLTADGEGWEGGYRGGKSGLHGHAVPDNVRRGRPQGKCHRKQTAAQSCPCPSRGKERTAVRVKRCGKSAPRLRQRNRHGKPHREQNRIGTAWGLYRASGGSAPGSMSGSGRPGWLLEAPGNRRSRGMAVTRRAPPAAIQNPAYRPADM